MKLKSAAEKEGTRQRREREPEEARDGLSRDVQKQTAVERQWKHCRSEAASACLDLSELGL